MADFRYGFFGQPDNKKIGLHLEEKSKTSHVSDHKSKPLQVDTEGRRRPITALHSEMYVTRTETYTKERVQMETSLPMKNPLSPTYRRQSSHTRVQDDINNCFNCYGDRNKKITNKPSGYTEQGTKHPNGYNRDIDENDDSDDEVHKMMINHAFGLAPLGDTNGIGPMEPKAKTSSGWVRLSNATRDATPTHDMSLSAPMNDIEKAIEYFKEAVNFQFGKNSCPESDHPKKDSYTKTIDSTEAARRYGNFSAPPLVQGAHVATIDSKEAARKYKGTRV